MVLDVECSTPKECVETSIEYGVKRFYSEDKEGLGRFQWRETPPDDIGNAAEDSETAKYALLVRCVKVYDDPRKVLAVHSIVVQSPLLKKLLGVVLKDYPGVTVNLQRLEFSGRFEPLIHRWAELEGALIGLDDSSVEDRQTKEHAKLLFDVLQPELEDTIDASQDMKSKGVITYEHLWTLFQPGTRIFSQRDGHETVLELVTSDYAPESCYLTCMYVDWDGSKFGTRSLSLSISAYDGTRPITDLAAYPIQYHPNETGLRQRLIKRGGKAETLAGSHYKEYHGIGWKENVPGRRDRLTINGRVMIDAQAWNVFNPSQAVFVAPLDRERSLVSGSIGSWLDMEDVHGGHAILTEEQKLICTPILRGYSLKLKLWMYLFVDSVQDIAWSARAFDSLVLPSDQKDLIRGLTESQKKSGESFDDLIQGKGKGIVFLLHGPPGVGKTLTAESIAEHMRVPLYLLSAGDIALDPHKIETELREIFGICTKWHAILLLDEADVFLEQRSLNELERNKLVSIFLRLLEYYEGIMFLATNRVNVFDAAFHSRIHCSIRYPELNFDGRRMVWQNLLTAAKLDSCVSGQQLDQLARVNSNGRQIKNALKTAQLLAMSKREPFAYKHVMFVLNATKQFVSVSGVRGQSFS